MMTIDDEGEGGVLANDDVITGTQFFGKFLGFFMNFSKIFLRIWGWLTRFLPLPRWPICCNDSGKKRQILHYFQYIF